VKGLILAAGMGTRLLPLTADRPKPLVDIGGVTLMGRMIAQCAEIGLDEVVIVTGYMHDFVVQWLQEHPAPIPTRTVLNSQYATINNAHSVFVAREAMEGEAFVKFDGDLILETGILQRLVDHPAPTTAVIDAAGALDAEAMKAIVDEDSSVRAFGKWLELSESSGESIGVEKIGAEDGAAFFDAIHQRVHVDGELDIYYEDVYHTLLQRDWSMAAITTEGGIWSEVDNAEDLAFARKCHAQITGQASP
jgi:choline kinase